MNEHSQNMGRWARARSHLPHNRQTVFYSSAVFTSLNLCIHVVYRRRRANMYVVRDGENITKKLMCHNNIIKSIKCCVSPTLPIPIRDAQRNTVHNPQGLTAHIGECERTNHSSPKHGTRKYIKLNFITEEVALRFIITFSYFRSGNFPAESGPKMDTRTANSSNWPINNSLNSSKSFESRKKFDSVNSKFQVGKGPAELS